MADADAMAQASNELEARLEASGAATTFFKGCSWSPDGLCLLTATDSSQILLFNSPARCLHAESATEAAQGGATASLDAAVPRAEGDAGMDVCGETPPGPAEDLTPVLSVQEGEMVYDYCWYPRMNSYEPSSCCFLSTTRDHPLHLWDAYTGRLRCTYRAYDHLDEISAAHSVAFSPDGTQLFAGFKNCVRIFDVGRPGRTSSLRKTTQPGDSGQRGIVSCISFAASTPSMYACGSFAKSVGVYDDRTGQAWALLDLESGVTQTQFSPDGSLLYTACRQSDAILCWDIRNTVEVLSHFGRQALTNQRVQFDVTPDGATLVSGSQDGTVRVFDARSTVAVDAAPKGVYQAHKDSANGVSVHPSTSVLATVSGQRHFHEPVLSSESSDESSSEEACADFENSIKLWSVDLTKQSKDFG